MSFNLSEIVTRTQNNVWYALSLVVLAFAGASMLAYEFTSFATPEVIAITTKLDLVIACIFLTDFILGMFFNTEYSKQDYWRKNWLDFISSIPITSDMARALRILRAVRALRVISSALDIWFTRKRYQQLKNRNKDKKG